MKLPAINVPGVGRYHAKNLPRPDAAALGRATGDLAAAAASLLDADTDITSATGDAAQELSELRAKLETSNTIPADEVPEGIEFANTKMVTDERGEEKEIELPFAYTHQVAEQWWQEQSAAIVNKHAATISSKVARAKFVDEVTQRYVAPGSLAIGKASIVKKRTYNWSVAIGTINDVVASDGPTAQREDQAKEILARQLAMGADPTMVSQQLAAIGPRIDQIDAQNALKGATSVDAIDQIEEEIWSGGNRMAPSTRATLSVEADKRRKDFQDQNTIRQRENADQMFVALIKNDLTLGQVAAALGTDQITSPNANIMRNALTGGSTTKASNEFTLSRWRGEIAKLPWTGGNSRVKAKANFMRNSIQMAAMGLNPNGTPTGQPAAISGVDVLTLMKDIDTKVKTSLETPEYADAWELVKTFTGVTSDIYGALYGNQGQRDAAILFKQSLDNYMNLYGVDAKPIDFFNANKGSFSPEKFSEGVDKKFYDQFPQARQFMNDVNGVMVEFDEVRQDAFVKWLRDNASTLDPSVANEMAAQFMAYYRGQGIAPGDGELMLEPDNPLYHQFEQ